MKIVIQRTLSAKVEVGGETVGEIGRGMLVFFGAGKGDTEADCERLAAKIAKLRIFADDNGKTNLNIDAVGGDILAVSQFTLYADCNSGNRPFFGEAADPVTARKLYDYFCECCQSLIKGKVEKGVFKADMKVSLVNDGPFTIML